MNRIKHETGLLLTLAAEGKLPGYPAADADGGAEEASPAAELTEYFSGENDALARRLEALWAQEPGLRQCIPLVLAAVEKSRAREDSAVLKTELYNYTL